MSICFFDVDANNIKRYFYDVFDESVKPSLILLYDKNEVVTYKKNCVKDNGVLIDCIAFVSDSRIESILIQKSIKQLVIIAHRIPDLRLVAIAKKLEIEVVYLQHGHHKVFLKRDPSFYFSKLKKSFSYLVDCFKISMECKSLMMPFRLFLVHVFGFSRSIYSKHVNLFPDKAFVFSDYAIKWHTQYYFFDAPVIYKVMGTPDLKKYKMTPPYNSRAICYCYQTLIEDGTGAKAIVEEFYKKLLKWSLDNDLELVVKGHPRMNIHYKKFFQENGVNVVFDDVPFTNMVIGHYSVLLPFWAFSGSKVAIVELKGVPIPPFISNWASVFSNLDELNIRNDVQNDLTCLNYYFCDYFKPPII
jgi:hypothetical protein